MATAGDPSEPRRPPPPTAATAAGPSTLPASHEPPGESAGDEIGAYRLVQRLGEGGFGVVWLADRTRPFTQRVAVKILKPGMDSRAVVARFQQERQALALMDHPNVARVLDGGVTPAAMGARPYFVMEYVPGQPLTDYCDERRLTLRQRLELFAVVCDAVQHAHMRGIIHRDLKPANILVTTAETGTASPSDGVGAVGGVVGGAVVKVIDFGIAKAVAPEASPDSATVVRTMLTEQGRFVGTPDYMAPEQAGATGGGIDVRTDVYALGVVLYELLAGARPFESSQLFMGGYAEFVSVLRDAEPPTPSRRLSSFGAQAAAELARRRSSDADRVWRELRRELEWIPLRAIRKEPHRRYQSASELADDVRRYLSGLPLAAGPESRAYRVRKFVRRHRGSVAAGAAMLVLLVGGVVGTSIGLVRAEAGRREAVRAGEVARRERHAAEESQREAQASAERAQRDRDRAVALREFLIETLKAANPDEGGDADIAVSEAMFRAVRRIDAKEVELAPDVEIDLRVAISRVLAGLGYNDQSISIARRAYEMVQAGQGGPDAQIDANGELGQALLNAGRPDEALPYLEHNLRLLREKFGGDHDTIAAALTNLGLALDSVGQPDRAEPHLREAVEMELRLAPGGRDATPTSLGNLALFLQRRGKAEEAQPLLVKALELSRRFKGELHPDTAVTLNNLGGWMLEAGRMADAEPLFAQSLAIRRRLYPGDHPDLALAIANLGAMRGRLGRYEDALPLLVEACEMFARMNVEVHPSHAAAWSARARCESVMGRPEAALAAARRAVELAEAMPDGHPLKDDFLRQNQALIARGGKPDVSATSATPAR